MVKRSYADIDASYKAIRRHACNQSATSVVILVATEVDALASARMLTQLLRSDHIVYSMQSVSNKQHIEQEIANFPSTIKTVFMINCGATLNIPKLFRLDDADVDYRVYVLDNHRPFHLANVYSRSTTLFCLPGPGPELRGSGQGAALAWEDGQPEPGEGEGDDLSEQSDDDDDDDDDEEHLPDEDDVGTDDEGDDEQEGEQEAEADFGDGDADGGEDEDGEEEAEEAEEGAAAVADAAGTAGADAEKDSDAVGVEQLDEARDAGGAESDTHTSAEADADADADKDSDAPMDAGDAPADGGAAANDGIDAGPQRKRRRRRAGPADDDDDDDDEEVDEAEEDALAGFGLDDYDGDTSGEAADTSGETLDDEEDAQIHVGGKRKRQSDAQRRKESIRNYYNKRHTCCGVTSYILLELVRGRTGSHLQLDNIWQAILGVTDQYQRQRIPEYRYNEMCADLKLRLADHLATSEAGAQYLIAREGEGELQVQGSKMGHIKETPEFRFFMYRHWSLFDSMSYSPYIAAKLGAWQSQGSERLKELLAKLGMPLQQCKQSYNFMDPKLRDHFRKKIQDLDRQQFKLDDPEVMYTSFCRFNSYKNPVVAFDIVLASQAILEAYDSKAETASSSSSSGAAGGSSSSSSSSSSSGGAVVTSNIRARHMAFQDAYDCLGMKSDDLLKRGVESAISIQKMIVTRARVMLEGSDAMEKLRNLYWAKVNCTRETHSRERVEGGIGSPFERPMVLTRLGQYIMDVKQNQTRADGGWSGPKLMPLILSYEGETSDTAIVVGICPIYMKVVDPASGMQVERFESSLGGAEIDTDSTSRLLETTNFKKYFRVAAKEARAGKYSLVEGHTCNEHFDTNTIELHRSDLDIFVRTLDFVLTNVRRQR